MGIRFKEALKSNFSHSWKILPQIYDKHGLSDIETDICSSDRVVETRKAFTKNGMQAIFGWARLVSTQPGSLPLSELPLMERQADRDIENGIYVRFDIHVAIGFYNRAESSEANQQ
jgi:hypothetical protein